MSDRRVVRVADSFFDELDRQLPAERGPNGEPSSTDFLVADIPAIVERFATDFDRMPEAVEGVPQVRVLVNAGRVVRAFAVFGLLIDDGAVELVGIAIHAT